MSNTEERILYILIGILFANLFITVWENINRLGWILVLISAVIGLIIYSELFYVKVKDKIVHFNIISTTILIIITYVDFYGEGISIRYFYFIVFYQIFRVYSKHIGLLIYSLITTLHIIIRTYDINEAKIVIKLIANEVGLFLLNLTIIMLILNIKKQNEKLEVMRTELTLKNINIDNTHNRLLQAYNQLETLTIVEERNKIAHEMHDTVGHTLTTALVELEVGKMLLKQNKEESFKKLNGATELVRKGLHDLRLSVKTLKDNIDYVKEIHYLIDNTIEHTDIIIKYQLDKYLDPLETPILSCLYRIIQEGITNSIKHGKAKEILIDVNIVDNSVKLTLSDNGKGTNVFNKGFGINAMEERVNELSGKIEFKFGPDSGFSIQAIIPIEGDK